MKTPLLIADLDFGEIVKILFIVFIALAAGLMKLFSGVKPAGQKPGGGPAAVPPRPAPTDALNNEIAAGGAAEATTAVAGGGGCSAATGVRDPAGESRRAAGGG
jgi:hypothetical protein